ISCPTSNLVLGGTRTLADITRSYAKLREYGVQVLRDEATAINVEKKRVSLKRIEDLPYDRLIVSPAVDLMHEAIEGYDAEAQKTILHAWKAGPETVALRQQLEAMPDGGVCVIGVPRSPFRCPPETSRAPQGSSPRTRAGAGWTGSAWNPPCTRASTCSAMPRFRRRRCPSRATWRTTTASSPRPRSSS